MSLKPMTTFLLHGGGFSKAGEGNNIFFRKLTSLVEKDEVKILLCYWARPKEEWEERAAVDAAKILKETHKSVVFHVIADEHDLFEKLPDFDVLFVAGGYAELIEPHYEKLALLKSALHGKIYAGSSMGAFLVSKQYVLSLDGQDISETRSGVGILPLQMLCHWSIETKKEQKLALLQASSELPILTINEGEFVTFYQ